MDLKDNVFQISFKSCVFVRPFGLIIFPTYCMSYLPTFWHFKLNLIVITVTILGDFTAGFHHFFGNAMDLSPVGVSIKSVFENFLAYMASRRDLWRVLV